MKRAAAGACLAVLVLACGPNGTQPAPSPAVRDLKVIQSVDVAWRSDRLVVVRRGDDSGSSTELVVVDPAGGAAATVDVDVPGCPTSEPHTPLVAAGRLFVVIDCLGIPNPRVILAEVPANGALTELLVLPAAPDAYDTPNGGESWIASHSSGFCAWIDVYPEAAVGIAWPIVVDDDARAFTVAESRDATDCDRTPLADDVAFGKGGQVAFMASPAAMQLSGTDRFDAVWNLYLATGKSVVRVASGFTRPTQVAFHPLSGDLTVAARVGSQWGIWRVTLDGLRELLYVGKPIRFAWSPDGSQLAVIELVGPDGDPSSPTRLILVAPSAR